MSRIARWSVAALRATCWLLIATLAVSWALSGLLEHNLAVWNEKLDAHVRLSAQWGRVCVAFHRFHAWSEPDDKDFHARWSVWRLPNSAEVTEHEVLKVGWDKRSPGKGYEPERRLIVPHAYLILLAAIVPATRRLRQWRRRQRARTGLCAHCGYDVRSNPAQCSECGRNPDPRPCPGRLRARWRRARPARRRALAGTLIIVIGLAAWVGWHAYLEPFISFTDRASEVGSGYYGFNRPPDAPSLRYLAPRQPRGLYLRWDESGFDAALLRTARLPSVTHLSIEGIPNADGLFAELTQPDPPLPNLTELDLPWKNFTDAGMSHLARTDSSLKEIRRLHVNSIDLTPAGFAELTRPDTGLANLRSLQVGYDYGRWAKGLGILARPDSGLKHLHDLSIGSELTPAVLSQFAAPGTGLAPIEELYFNFTKMSDAGVAALARPGGGLKRLTLLSFWGEDAIGQAGVAALAHPDTGLTALKTLLFVDQKLDVQCLHELTRPAGGLKQLTCLKLWGYGVTNRAIIELARPDNGLSSLQELILYNTSVTPPGIAALKQARPALKISTEQFSDLP